MIKNTLSTYGSVSKFLHWIVALGVIIMLVVGFTMDGFDEPLKSQMYGYHEELGLTVMAILLFRLYWRWWNPQPELPATIPSWQRLLARLGHYLLYIALGVMIASGWAKSTSSGYTPNFYGLFDLPMPFIPVSTTIKHLARQVHVTTVWVLISLISLHILAALNHHFIYKDNVLKRMLPSRKQNPSSLSS
jgi:cytochrome b561